MIVGQHVVKAEVGAEAHIAEKPKALPAGGFFVLPDDRLDLLVIRGHAAAYQAVGGRQPVEQVNRRLCESFCRNNSATA